MELTHFNVIIGTNGSGKSSVLQALHWMFQSGRNRTIDTNATNTDGSTLSEKDATYMPSPDYKSAGYGQEYGNFQGAPKLEVSIEAVDDQGNECNSDMWIKSARNEGISVHVPSGNIFTATLRDRAREFSAYIPGLAGIPLSEEKRSKLIVQRLAAAGDANTVLRNILDMMRLKKENQKNDLLLVQEFVSKVMDDFALKIEFDEDKNTNIRATFQTAEMRLRDTKRFKPLELAGIGFLQIIQIFAYLVYFRPVVLLIDEPDAHLHPTAQERLMPVLAEAALKFGTQIILTTHSPSVVRSLPTDAKVIWMKAGKVETNGELNARNLMGWGLLDKRILLVTEDGNSNLLRSILRQWPDLERITALWPLGGVSKIPSSDTISALHQLFGGSLNIVIHRDRDFMMPDEVEHFSRPYLDKGFAMWITQCSDIEAYWGEAPVIAAHFKVQDPINKELLTAATKLACANDLALMTQRKKRAAINGVFNKGSNSGSSAQYGDNEVRDEAKKTGDQHQVLGKDLIGKIRQAAQSAGIKGHTDFGTRVPDSLISPIAEDLKVILMQAA